MTTDAQIKQWAQVAESKFEFLRSRGYTPPIGNLDSAWATLTYFGSELGIRLEVETDGFFMFVALFRPADSSREASLYLQECLRRLRIRNEAISNIHKLRGDFAHHSEMLSTFADALQSNLTALESKVRELF